MSGCDTVVWEQLVIFMNCEAAPTHLRRLWHRMGIGHLAPDGGVWKIDAADPPEDAETFWQEFVHPFGVMNWQKFRYFYHGVLGTRTRIGAVSLA